MFESLSSRLADVFGRLTRRGVIGESDILAAMKEVRVALLEADVALPVVRSLTDSVRHRALGEKVLRSVTPGQMVIRIVHDQIRQMLGEAAPELSPAPAPACVMMVGLQGSGKTTTTAKLAAFLKGRGKSVLMASLDTRRPAAMEQLAILGEQAGLPVLPVVPGQDPPAIAGRALQAARLRASDVLLLDTAGRMHVDDGLMQEMQTIGDTVRPSDIFLVADALTGQDALTVGQAFSRAITLTGVILTRMDGDGRGGAVLSMRHITGVPVRFLGVGEKTDQLEPFHPDRVASRILGMGDIVSLVEKASALVEQEEAERIARRMQQGTFSLEDMRTQLRQLQKMGGIGSILPMLPGMAGQGKLPPGAMDERVFGRQEAIISSMTPAERRNPGIIQASRKRRIAAGSGTRVEDVNRLLRQHLQMAGMLKKVARMGDKGLARSGLGKLLGAAGGGLFPPAGPGRFPGQQGKTQTAPPGGAGRRTTQE